MVGLLREKFEKHKANHSLRHKFNYYNRNMLVVPVLVIILSWAVMLAGYSESFMKRDIFQKYALFILFIFIVFSIIFIRKTMMNMLTSFIIPIEKLKQGAIEIKNGNLDYKFDYSCNFDCGCMNEIDLLFKEFEEMRLELLNSRKQKEEYDRKRNELISNISHDIKTPISSIIGYLEGIMDGVADSEEKKDKYIETIYKKALYMNKLINDLALFSRLDINQLDFEFEVVYSSHYLNSLYEDYKFELMEKAVEFSLTEHLGCDTKALIDKKTFRRVFDNIINNSINHMNKQDPKISIYSEEQGNNIIIKIEDNGVGIPSDKLEAIFERFYKIDSSRNTEIGGSGLGLSIAKQIISAHQGNIWAESIPGEGTSIILAIPKYPDAS